MSSPIVLLAVLVVALLAGVAGYAMGYLSTARATAGPAPEVAERDAFIEHLREVAWQHRDVSPELSTILLDEIAQHHHRRGQLPGGGS